MSNIEFIGLKGCDGNGCFVSINAGANRGVAVFKSGVTAKQIVAPFEGITCLHGQVLQDFYSGIADSIGKGAADKEAQLNTPLDAYVQAQQQRPRLLPTSWQEESSQRQPSAKNLPTGAKQAPLNRVLTVC